MIDMPVWVIDLLLMILVGVIGAASRILVQRWSYKAWPHDSVEGYLVALALGAIGGYVSWELPHYVEWYPPMGRIGALVMGYFCGDILENLLEGFIPKPPSEPPTG